MERPFALWNFTFVLKTLRQEIPMRPDPCGDHKKQYENNWTIIRLTALPFNTNPISLLPNQIYCSLLVSYTTQFCNPRATPL